MEAENSELHVLGETGLVVAKGREMKERPLHAILNAARALEICGIA